MARIFFSLIVKKYSLRPVKYQIAIQSLLIGFVCLFGVLPVSINDTVVQLSIKQALIWFHFFSSENGVSLEIFSFYLIGSIQYFLISHFLSYFFKSPMGSLAILFLFPILVQPFIERVVEPLTSYLFYNIVADTILGRASNLQLCIYVIGLVCSLGATIYLLVRNQEVK